MGFKFIHTADIHLDSPLRGLSAYENAPAERLRNVSREALKELVTRAIDEEVSFVVISGDLYDGDWRDYNTGIFFAGRMGRLADDGTFVVNDANFGNRLSAEVQAFDIQGASCSDGNTKPTFST